MSVVDYFLNSLIKHLQKTQKARKRKRKAKSASAGKPGKSAKPESLKKKSINGKRKTASRKGDTVRRPVKKTAKKTKKTIAKIPEDKKAPGEIRVGEITHFFPRIQVVVLKMTGGSLSVGDKIHIKGKGTDFVQKVGSLQIESADVKIARKGQLVGLKVKKDVKVGSMAYKEGK